MQPAHPLAFSSKLAYGVGQIAEGLKNTAFGLFVLFYYNQVLGVPGSLCGLAMGIALLFDAVTDPLAGSLSDNWRSRFGRRHPFMYASALPLGVAFFGLFSPPQLTEQGLFLWLLCFAVLTRSAMTLYHVPHIALGAELSDDFEERTVIVAWRQAFGYVGALIAGGLAFLHYFSDGHGGRLNQAAYAPFAGVLAVGMIITIWISAWGTRKEIPRLPKASPTSEGSTLARLVHELSGAFRNVSFRWLFAGVLIVFVMVGVDAALNLYMYEFFWELSGPQIMLVTLTYPVGMIAGTAFTRALHRRFDKKLPLVLGTAGWALGQILPVVLRLVDWFPANGTAALISALMGFKLVQGIVVQQALVTFGSMMADVADEHELESGRRQEGIFFGAVAFSGKAASGVGNIVAGVALDLIAWPRGQAIRSAADIAPDTLVQLGIVYGPVVAGCAVVSVWCYTHYRLDQARHQEILAQLMARRAAARPVP
jgi:Na+/melibiose symporter-like transporter